MRKPHPRSEVTLILIDTISIEALLATSFDLFLVEPTPTAEAFPFIAGAGVFDVTAFLAVWQAGFTRRFSPWV
jgi:hypothetical protein